MNILFPINIQNCIKTLEKHGYEAFCVGGSVRDLLMGNNPHDYDIASNAPPDEVAKIFDHTIPTGIAHGTVTVILNGDPVEITRYRTDGKYEDYRRPKSVDFVDNLEADLSRRDFTINAIAYNPRTGIVDPYGGQMDIKLRKISCVGEPETRFREDALRIMRAFRFASQLGFNIEKETKSAALKCSDLLREISRERIFAELQKLLSSCTPSAISSLVNHGGMEFCGLNPCEIPNEFNLIPLNISLRFAFLCKLCNADSALVLKNLKSDTATLKEAKMFQNHLNSKLPTDFVKFKKLLLTLSLPQIKILLQGRKMMYGEDLDYTQKYLDIIETEHHPFRISMLDITGNDLKDIGIAGCSIGDTLDYLLDICLVEPGFNKKAILIEKSKQKLRLH
ncbi:MAG: CCA tRNA nucleotidyltransferase [Oscillospiraceae bacterium]|nr:CCA tRNA nucleotidyltransferase [Oscillospiraceae bacterium]